jgi:hypothetical protein
VTAVTLPIAIFGAIVAGLFVALGWLWARRRADSLVAGMRRCRTCQGTGAVAGADTPSGFEMCQPCNGTGWIQG